MKVAELTRQQEAILREREVKASEQSADSARRSAMSAERSEVFAERSTNSAEQATRVSRISLGLNILALLIGTGLTLWQNNRSNEQDNKVSSLTIKVRRLDSLLKSVQISTQIKTVFPQSSTAKKNPLSVRKNKHD